MASIVKVFSARAWSALGVSAGESWKSRVVFYTFALLWRRRVWTNATDWGAYPILIKYKSLSYNDLWFGGGGSRTRVRKYGLEELYMRVRF